MSETITSYETLEVERDGAVATVSISNPPMNVINLTMGRELKALCAELAGDSSVRVVVFRSANEGVFIAGADISLLGEIGNPELLAQFKDMSDVFDHIAALPQPTICAIGGTALGGGCEFALACDFRFMGDGFGEIGLPEVRLACCLGEAAPSVCRVLSEQHAQPRC